MQNLSYLGLDHHRPIIFRLFTQSGPITDLQRLSCRTGASIPKQYGVIVFISFALSVWQQPPDLVGAVLAKGIIEKNVIIKGRQERQKVRY